MGRSVTVGEGVLQGGKECDCGGGSVIKLGRNALLGESNCKFRVVF